MFENELYNVPLDKVLVALGSQPGREKDMWTSPLREETKPSLHINPAKNVWYDFGISAGGTNVDLVMRVRRCCKEEAYSFLAHLDPSARQAHTRPKPEPRTTPYVKAVREIRSSYLLRYLDTRKIPENLARRYLKEVILFNPEKSMHYTLLGLPNNSGAYAFRSPSGMKSTNKADVTTINTAGEITAKPSSPKVAVFEGMFDFLSWRVMQSSELPTCDVVILNSVNNLKRAADYIQSHAGVTCFLDNDAAGEKCYQDIRNLMKGKDVLDMSDLYGQYKDLNEMLQASRGYSASMNLTPSH